MNMNWISIVNVSKLHDYKTTRDYIVIPDNPKYYQKMNKSDVLFSSPRFQISLGHSKKMRLRNSIRAKVSKHRVPFFGQRNVCTHIRIVQVCFQNPQLITREYFVRIMLSTVCYFIIVIFFPLCRCCHIFLWPN